jgi:nucleotide-binding universal stress UspA family protein
VSSTEENVNQGDKPVFHTIVVPIDLEQESSWVKTLPVAVHYATDMEAKLHVITVVPDNLLRMTVVAQLIPEGYEERLERDAEKKLAKVVEANVQDDTKIQQAVRRGNVYKEILRYARDVHADLIIMAAHRPEVSDYLLGSNAAEVVHHSGCSVWIIR